MTTPFPLKTTSTLPRFLLFSNSNHNRIHHTKFPRSPVSRHSHILPFRTNPNFKALAKINSDEEELPSDWFVEPDESDLPVEICYTRTLSPALTFNAGISKIQEELVEIKSVPPAAKSGIFRVQVPIPPGAKASSWFCSHPQSAEVFPQFYFSQNNLDNPHLDSHSFSGGPGVSGIGASVYFTGCSSTSGEWKSIERYLSLDSPLIRAYGFTGIYFDKEAATFKQEAGSYYVFIPQIELVESGGISLLAATLAWDDGSVCTFNEAIHSLEFFLSQASRKDNHGKCINSVRGESNLLEDNNVEMVIITAKSIEKKDSGVLHLQPKEASATFQYCFRLTSKVAVSHNVFYRSSEMGYLLQSSANINAVWASLIVDECSRLGLTYFCIAPGSRSSPLAVAASTHPCTTCISCYDERSLAFHAVGYARGSCKPAIVITSSGTAVSNLLPAVVEASQDFVPLLLLTADRPPELQNTGANQAINQVNHFGSFVRSFFSLPTPTDCIPARVVLTTVDSAVYSATHAPYGPVHINCPFREPLEDSPKEWMPSCLKGLDIWKSGAEPFTKYVGMQHSDACDSNQRQLDDVHSIIQFADKGLLLIGSIHTEDEMWAALLLAKHLSWPTVADISSGLRFKRVLTASPWFAERILFIDHLDHALLSDSVRGWVQPDVVIQLGSRITSKRISQMLEVCSPCSYIMVDKHPYRHDPSHIVTHRIQSTITEFAESLLRFQVPRKNCRWSEFMQALNTMVAKEIEFQICCENTLTEPHVMQVLSEALPCDAALFIGNSMAIRDANMYGRGWMNHTTDSTSIMSSGELSCLGIRVSANRGASGIDGLLSTAIGFAVGSYKRVFCLIGDISFLHDTNGLAILKQRAWRKPLTILVINNHGGAIFSLLPIAAKTKPYVLDRYFYTSHNVSIGKLCEAHSVKHLQARTKLDLQHALATSQDSEVDCIIEVESSIEDNATFHSVLAKSACQAAETTLSILSCLMLPDRASTDFLFGKIEKVEYSLYRIQLSAPPTSTRTSGDLSSIYKEGFILSIRLEDGSVGWGEVAPLEIHEENLQDAEEQLRFLLHVIRGAKLSYLLPLLRGSFSSWIWGCLGILPHSMFPSVRCGVEMAVLSAMAARQGCSLANLLCHERSTSKESSVKVSPNIQICALLDSNATPEEVAQVASELVKEGFGTIKIKVGRRASPFEDAAVIHEIRKKVGYQVKLRADANRSWTYEQASQFGLSVQNCDLQYIEEPVNSEDDIIKFCEGTGLPVALDETIDSIQEDPLGRLASLTHPGIIAVVIKPSVVGGFENAALIAKWAQNHDKLAVVSSAFESSLGLSAYVQFSYYLEQQNADICRLKNKEPREPVSHGLGTYRWLGEDVTTETLGICGHPHSKVVKASTENASQLLLNFKINPRVIQRSYTGEDIKKYQKEVTYRGFSSSLRVLEVGKQEDNIVIVFLHGFLGSGEDWVPIMKAFSTSTRCISIDLPGHGQSWIQNNDNEESRQEPSIATEVTANILSKLISNITSSKVVLVGYSMGARIALYMTLHCGVQVKGAVIISGSPGLKDVKERRKRIAQDDERAQSLRAHGLDLFLDTWYSGELWRSLKAHPHYEQMISRRARHNDVHALANALSDLSVGRQPSLWDDLKQTKKPLLFLYGEKDKKFKEINQQMFHEIGSGSRNRDDQSEDIHMIEEIPDCGHAVHLENPLSLINAISKFLNKINEKVE